MKDKHAELGFPVAVSKAKPPTEPRQFSPRGTPPARQSSRLRAAPRPDYAEASLPAKLPRLHTTTQEAMSLAHKWAVHLQEFEGTPWPALDQPPLLEIIVLPTIGTSSSSTSNTSACLLEVSKYSIKIYMRYYDAINLVSCQSSCLYSCSGSQLVDLEPLGAAAHAPTISMLNSAFCPGTKSQQAPQKGST